MSQDQFMSIRRDYTQLPRRPKAEQLKSLRAVLLPRQARLTLADVLRKLSPDQREVILLWQREGLSFPQIAARTGQGVDNVKRIWARALARIGRFSAGRS
jgi:DNA-directed RNA polymerase specialized sigma24 family protein